MEWRDVLGYEGLYRVSDVGAVESRNAWTRWQWRALKPGRSTKCGHLSVGLWRDGVKRNRKVHRLVLEAFVGPCPDGMECRHLDGNPTNNKLDNLVWGTSKENEADKLLHGTDNRGERQGGSKLTEAEVIEIRRLRASGTTGQAIADKYGINQHHVSHICLGRRWAHVTEGL